MRKLCILQGFCREHAIKINLGKTKFFVILNDEAGGKRTAVCGWLCRGARAIYTWVLLLHAIQFLRQLRNTQRKNMPSSEVCIFHWKKRTILFIVKRRVFEAALKSSLLHECGSWVGVDRKPVIKLYHWAMKMLLRVRKNTSPCLLC